MADDFRTGFDWEDLRYFVALARYGSLSATARALGVNHATVSRRIASLEASAGQTLFDRRPQGYVLTASGERMLDGAARMEDAAQGLRRLDGDAPLAGLIRIAATPAIAEAFLIPRLVPFTRAHPALDIEVLADRRLVSLQRHEADIALRLGRPGNSELVGQRVAVLAFGLYAREEIRDAFIRDEPVGFIGFDDTGISLPETVWRRQHLGKARLAFRSNGQLAQVSAARAGLGIAVLPHFLGSADDILMRVPFPATPPERELWMLSRPGSDGIERLSATKAFLVELFRHERNLFAGV